MKKRMAKQGIAMQVVASNALAELQQRLDRKEQPTHLSAHDIARLLEVGSRLERFGRGDSDEEYQTLEIRVRIEDPPPENSEDLAAAEAAVESALRGR